MEGPGGQPSAELTSRSSAVELAAAGDRQVKGSLAKVVLSYVRRLLGDDAVATVLADAEHHRPHAGLDGAASWISSGYILAIADAAAEICGEAEIGRRSGEELMRMQQERGTVDFILATGSVDAALALAANGATKMSNGRRYVVEETGPLRARIIGRYADSSIRHPFFCGQAAGYFGGIPGAFGFSGLIAEVQCQCRGDERCVYEIRW